MACDMNSLAGYLRDFSGQRPLDAIICPFAGPNGAGMGVPVVALIFVGVLGMGLAVRDRNPAPLIVVGILSAGLFATSLPGAAGNIFAIILMAGIIASGFYLYKRFRTSL